ncbi:MAG: hypothetical protein ABI398_11500 [Devosia sp.]
MSGDSTLSRRFAGLIGPTLMALAGSEALNMDIYAAQAAPVVYLNGTILFVAGLAIVRGHNRWGWSWALLVTLTGWGAMTLGLYRMFTPRAPQAAEGMATNLMLAALFLVGAILSFVAYIRRGER